MKNTKTNNVKRRSFLAIALVTAILFSFIACEDDDKIAPVIDIRLNKNSLNFILGGESDKDTEKLTVTVTNTDSKEVTWSSSKSDVASVDDSGVVTALKSGIAIITATLKNGGKTATCTVTVQEIFVNTKDIEMISIPAGTFIMGQKGITELTFSVTIPDLYMSTHEVTQKQYETVMGALPSSFSDDPPPIYGVGDDYPVYYVSWYDALVFCNKLSEQEGLTPAYKKKDTWTPVPSTSNDDWNEVIIDPKANGYRLPTEAQWEYACRAGTTTVYNTGDTISDNTGWYTDNSGKKTHEVGKKTANAWGLYDMHGNVLEWCWDWYETYLSNPMGASSGSVRVGRGGGWDDTPEFLRSAFRYYYDPYIRNPSTGFRVVRPY